MQEILFDQPTESKESLKPLPYVVSEDMYLLLQRWAVRKGFTIPCQEFFVETREDFRSFMRNVFPGFETATEEELTKGIKQAVQETGLFPVSLDNVYFSTPISLDITRAIDYKGQDCGLRNRPESTSLLQQFKRFGESGIKEVVLIDDVIFSGDQLLRVIKILNSIKVKVPVICAGIGIKEGLDKLRPAVDEIYCTREYENVVDQICERDFYPGVPLCGRTMQGSGNFGAPYLLPFGNPGKWASIPSEWQLPLSTFCLNQTIKIFGVIENSSGKPVYCSDLDRGTPFMPQNQTRFVDLLDYYYTQIKLIEKLK